MSWVKLDDAFPRHPKLLGLTPAAKWAYIEGVCYSSQYLTDGFVAVGVVASRLAQDLVRVGLWDVSRDEDGNTDGRGYVVHDYLEYNPPKERVLAERKRARERRAKGGRSSGEVRATASRPDPSPPDPVPTHIASLREAPKANTADRRLAETLLDASSRAAYMLRRMQERDKRWQKVSTGAMIKLGRKYGAATLIEALSYVYEDEAQPLAPYPYLESVCVRIQMERAS